MRDAIESVKRSLHHAGQRHRVSTLSRVAGGYHGINVKRTVYHPPCKLTPEIVAAVARIAETVDQLATSAQRAGNPRLRRVNRIRTIHGSLAIEGNTLSKTQITAILAGKRIIAPPREIQEVRNAAGAYELLGK